MNALNTLFNRYSTLLAVLKTIQDDCAEKFTVAKANRDVSGKQGQSGLDLNVMNHYNDTQCDAKTLSGCKSFIASLSLALEFSDEIQNNANGIHIDSMFIDEGFDTLDDTKLSQAIQAFMSISQIIRIVGIISHINWLDEKLVAKSLWLKTAQVVAESKLYQTKCEL